MKNVSRNRLKVIFVPNWSKNNPYQNLLAQSVNSGADVDMVSYPPGLRPLSSILRTHPNTDVIHLHWISELVARVSWGRSAIFPHFKVWILLFDLVMVRLKGVKLVWTVHNKFCHKKHDNRREYYLRKRLCRFVDDIIVHSDVAVEMLTLLYDYPIKKKARIIYHGNYNGCYPAPSAPREALRQRLSINEGEIRILYFGAIRPYKGVDTLIRAFLKIDNTKNTSLMIAGNVPDKQYQNTLINLIADSPRIDTRFGYIEDQALIDYLSVADVVALPFADTLTSGSTILAMTLGNALILSKEARVFGCVPEEGACYFSNEEQLTEILKSLSKLDLVSMGVINQKKANSMGWEKIGEMTLKVYRSK